MEGETVTRGGTEGEDKVKDVAMTEEGNGSGPSQEVGGKVEQTMNQTTTPPMNTNTNTNNQAANTTEDPNYEVRRAREVCCVSPICSSLPFPSLLFRCLRRGCGEKNCLGSFPLLGLLVLLRFLGTPGGCGRETRNQSDAVVSDVVYLDACVHSPWTRN
mmetsp:Transcript_4141/g.12052  ORF Transcript_4141/g.12052 Transcript_4141/m.12052 type:complete len:159 (-) Transcript_4141:4800-5276(-)